MVAGFDETNNGIFILYQYQDKMMQWSSANSEVSMSICGTPHELASGSTIHTSVVVNTNVNKDGRYAFLYKDGEIKPAGTLGQIK